MKLIKTRTFLVITLLLTTTIFAIISNKTLVTKSEVSNVHTHIFNPNADGELVIYTHDSFLAWGLDSTSVKQKAFEDFGLLYDVTVRVQEFSGMVEALNSLISQKNNPQADIVIGLDSVSINRAKEEEILKPITSGVNITSIPTWLIDALDPDKYLLPIDFGLIAIIFDTEYITTSSYPEILDLSFDDLLTLFGDDFALQDPTLSATGLNFLLYQIVFYEEILGLNWEDWWEDAKDIVAIDQSWSDSWARVFDTKEDHMMVSYGTDPAYNAFFNYSFEQNAALICDNSQEYGWMQIEGIGIVEGTTNETLSKLYLDYALSLDVQELIATNNWMFPANSEVTLHDCYDYAITTENVTLLNTLVSSSYIGDNYQTWLNTWERLIFGRGTWWIWTLFSALVVVAAIVITVYVFRRKTKLDVE